ncbi:MULTISPECIES: GNAT family N-acetyltransferase [unclassified Lysinibacillus]|uniref:GNAT family N-acetyltransferase n=1 Tax=unclassified Lysinibacillus TaxID=2636778 RepID=UPI00381E99D6
MNNITFDHIEKIGPIIFEDEFCQHVHYPEMLSRYDSNYILFKMMPSLTTFKEIEQMLRTFHQKHNQKHLKFIFPSNEKISPDIHSYLTEEKYDIGFLELYTIEPSQFATRVNHHVDVQPVTEDNLEVFLKLQYEEDLKYGETFATEKQALLKRRFHDPSKHQLLAYFDGFPAGSMELIEEDTTVEIDNLFVLEAFQRNGVGTQLQQYVMQKFHHKIVILVADGEDTARDMYQKQNYVYQGFQYEVLKVEGD